MALTPGTKFGAYDVVASVGAGGMGEVYRAHDGRLGRDVAIKILPPAFADDPERLARFEREARTLASLNHPNIATIYGLESVPSTVAGQTPQRALVMELVDGEDLSQLLLAGALPRPETFAIARQIALALEAAHDAGITHRDLKPANVKVRTDGTVKLLDFGLAKAPAADGGSSTDAMNSPTLTAQATAAGMILGTAAYMSPEQARGKPVDRRADIWAFGCVLFEMVAGRRPFAGDDISETLASVIKEEPAWSALPADLPESIRRLLRRCLEKDPRRRLSAIGDARLELDEPAAPPTQETKVVTRTSRSGIVWMAAGLLIAAVATAGAWAGWFRATPDAPLMRMTLLAPVGQSLYRDPVNMAISPDGRKMAFITGFTRESSRLRIRFLDRLDVREVEDTTGAQLPFWSPNSEMVGFFADGKLKVVSATNGRPQALADAPDGRGATWSRNGDIVFAATNSGPLSRVSQNGGAVTSASELVVADKETGHRFPSFLPDGDHFLYAALPSKSGQFDIYAGSLSSKNRQRVLTAEVSPFYAHPGYLIYTRDGVLLAHQFDAGRRALVGEALPIGDTPGEMNLEYTAAWPASASSTGALAYLSASVFRSRLVWLDQAGRETGTVDVPPGPHAGVSISRDGRKAVLTELAAPRAGLSLVDLSRGGLTPLLGPDAWNANTVWSPDNRNIVFSSDRNGPGDIYFRGIDDAKDRVLYKSADLFKYPVSWSADGKFIVFQILDPKNDNDLWTISPDDGKPPAPLLRTPANDAYGTISPDGKWLAYISNKAGAFDVYVQGFPTASDTHRITTGGTLEWGVWWKQDSSQLLILDATLRILLVDVKTSPTFAASPPRTVGQLRFPINGIFTVDATPDLSKLLAVVPEQADGARSMTVVLNWHKAIAK